MLGQTISKRGRPKAPCYKCKRRQPGCHSCCEDYQAWLGPLLKARDERLREFGPETVKWDAIDKAIKRRQRNGQN